MFAELARQGVHVVLSNSDTPLVRRLYRGFRVDRVLAKRAINSNAARRGKVAEVIVRPSSARRNSPHGTTTMRNLGLEIIRKSLGHNAEH